MAVLYGFSIPLEEASFALVSADLNEDNGAMEVHVRTGPPGTLLSAPENHEVLTLGPPQGKQLSIAMLDVVHPLIACLVSCVAGVAVRHIIECWNGEIVGFVDCLRNRGKAIAADSLSCAAACVAAHGGQ